MCRSAFPSLERKAENKQAPFFLKAPFLQRLWYQKHHINLHKMVKVWQLDFNLKIYFTDHFENTNCIQEDTCIFSKEDFKIKCFQNVVDVVWWSPKKIFSEWYQSVNKQNQTIRLFLSAGWSISLKNETL